MPELAETVLSGGDTAATYTIAYISNVRRCYPRYWTLQLQRFLGVPELMDNTAGCLRRV